MPNRQLTPEELHDLFGPLIAAVREQLQQLSGGHDDLLWALRRKLAKELSYDERGKPAHRKLLKSLKRKLQNGLCARCGMALPVRGAVLDRLEAMLGYTEQNTRLVCTACDTITQERRGYA